MKKNNLILFPLLLVLYELATYLSTDAYLPALPRIIADLATVPHLAQLTLTTWFLGSASMQLVMGPVTDHYGRRPVLLISLMSMFGVIGSALVSGIYNGKLISLAIILAMLSIIAFALRWYNTNITRLDV